ncbi:F0F1 ATP synthase subunit alpha [Patescibacteria group bacterium]|nr:F0F1 ATP synthase subunit alpha [Patescibacteria group bacterium]
MEIGYVKAIRGPIVYLDGLPGAKLGDIVESDGGASGFVSGLNSDSVEILIIRNDDVKPGTAFKPTGRNLAVPVGDFLLGRGINPLGEPIDDKGAISKNQEVLQPLDQIAPGVAGREFIQEQFVTGVSLVDTIVPIGRGQRELILGDARSGKTGFLIDVVINQKHQDTICVYACIGKPATDVYDLMAAVKREKALDKTIFVVSFSADAAPLIYLTPKAAFAVAGYFQKQGKNVLVILDDLGAHAKIYREISLLAERTPGREAYPGDIFYEHAHLLERAGKFNKQTGGGSITALPVVELGLTDFVGFIPTNIMSMTDGHLLFSANLYNQGQRPAVDLLLSVSRVGQQTQKHVQTDLAFKIKQMVNEADRLASLSSFSTELPPETRLLLIRREMIMEILRQPPSVNISPAKQIVLLALPFCHFIEIKDEKFLVAFKKTVLDALDTEPRLKEFVSKALDLPSANELIKGLEELGPVIMGIIGKVKPEGPATAAPAIEAAYPGVKYPNSADKQVGTDRH